MLSLLWLVPILPLAAFLVLAVSGGRLPHRAVTALAIIPVAVSAVIAVLIMVTVVWFSPAGTTYSQTLWEWIHVGRFTPAIGYYLDALSTVMMTAVSFIPLLILIYSTGFMPRDEGYSRFFCYMNLFVGSMLTLVLADNLLLLYLGWEGVGLCSYLLIGFWYKDPVNVRAALKAFYVTRIGDTAFAIGIFLLFTSVGTLDIQGVMEGVSRDPVGSALPTAAAALLLAGAVGKSAQLPLQTWLPDAMAGPTPVSALIHAATMVIAGVYLIARTQTLFLTAPAVMFAVAVVGTATLLLAAFSALTQHDIKRVLAYSTMSQIGYMFLALGAGAWTAAIYHFITHGLFKSALFLGAGILIHSFGGEHDIFKMGGVRNTLPLTTRFFTFAGLTLAAVPPLTITFNSKDVILDQVYLSAKGGSAFWALGLTGAFLTAAYTFRLFFIVFYGPARMTPPGKPARRMLIPFGILAFLGAIAGMPDLLDSIFGIRGFYHFLQTAMPEPDRRFLIPGGLWIFQGIYTAVSLTAIGIVYAIYRRGAESQASYATALPGAALHRLWFAGWGFDLLYRTLLVRPYVRLARWGRDDIVNGVYVILIQASRVASFLLSLTVNGNVRWYVAGVAGGAVIVVGILVFL
jgi:NADH-quinone oxidoreductase subunit L